MLSYFFLSINKGIFHAERASCLEEGKENAASPVDTIPDGNMVYDAFICQGRCQANLNCLFFAFDEPNKICTLYGDEDIQTGSKLVGPRFCPQNGCVSNQRKYTNNHELSNLNQIDVISLKCKKKSYVFQLL
jgi:hypothetical protein